MKNLSRLVFTLCMIAIATFSFAQAGGVQDMTEQANARSKRMKKELTLTDEQYAQVSEMNIATAKEIEEAKKNEATFEAENKRLEKEYEERLKTILTAEQFTNYQLLEKRKANQR